MPANRDQKKRLAQADRLYDRYGKPFEKEHRGKYILIYPDGRTIVGNELVEVLQRAEADVGPGGFIFKVGQKAVFKL